MAKVIKLFDIKIPELISVLNDLRQKYDISFPIDRQTIIETEDCVTIGLTCTAGETVAKDTPLKT